MPKRWRYNKGQLPEERWQTVIFIYTLLHTLYSENERQRSKQYKETIIHKHRQDNNNNNIIIIL